MPRLVVKRCGSFECTKAKANATNRRLLSSAGTGKAYRSIGSFHSDNVEELMRLPTDLYHPPSLPFESLPLSSEFLLKRHEWTFLNHGAFGASLQCGYDRAQQWRLHLEHQPLRFFDRDLLPHLVHSARQLAEFVNADRSGMALLPNVTTGINAVISGYVREHRNPQILLWDVSYGSVKKIAKGYCDRVLEIPLQESYSDQLDDEEVFLTALEDKLASHGDWTGTLFIIDHTTSNTALNLPVERLAKRAKEAGMLTLVDGAHGLLAQDIDFDQLPSVDIYLSNGHKWLSCPRGVAFLYCANEEIRETILRKPAVISHGLDDGYLSRFIWDGTRDYAAQLALPAVLDLWTKADPRVVRSWMHSKLTDAIRLIAESWHPMYANDIDDWAGKVTLGSMEMHSPMALVRLPPIFCGSSLNPKTSTDAKQIQDYLYDNKIEVPIKCINGVLYVRLSCHIYNELREYDRLAQVMLDFPR
ncbi:cysteine desulfurase [Fragilaria crotonensis]|nr:cysteine desulfurase [Fragilaria crotonensis]